MLGASPMLGSWELFEGIKEISLLGSRAVEGTHHPGHPAPTLTVPSLLGPSFWSSVSHRHGSLLCRPAVAPWPSPPSSLCPGCAGLGAQQLFWRLPDNSALYLPPVPPNTLVSAAALCCKFPWSNYVLIYDNPGRAVVEGGKRQSSLEVWGPPWLRLPVNFSIPVGGERSIPKQRTGLFPGPTASEATRIWDLASVCRVRALYPIPAAIQELGITPGSSRGECPVLCACPQRWLPRQGGNLWLPPAPGTALAWGRTLPPCRL